MDAIIFDMGGVIVDSEPIWIASKHKMLKEQGVDVPISYHYQFFGTTLNDMWIRMKEEFDLPLSVAQCIERGEKIRHEMMDKEAIKSIPGVIDLIIRLSESGVPLAIASSSSKKNINQVVDTFNIKSYFKVIVSGEDCVHSKPFPDVFLKAASELDVDPQRCLVIEDASNGVKAAKAAKMTCIGFQNPNFSIQNLEESDYIISNFDDLTLNLCENIFESTLN